MRFAWNFKCAAGGYFILFCMNKYWFGGIDAIELTLSLKLLLVNGEELVIIGLDKKQNYEILVTGLTLNMWISVEGKEHGCHGVTVFFSLTCVKLATF